MKAAEETVTLQQPVTDAYQRCLGATEALPGSKVKSADEAANRIELKTKMSMKSWGEKVALELSPEGEGATSVHVSSKPSVPITMADYGKNQANVNDVVGWLRGAPSAESPPPAS
jgi:hypothetical protein